MKLTFGNREYLVERHPPSGDRSLQAVSAADEHLLGFLSDSGDLPDGPVVHHDRFGALAVPLAAAGIRPTVSAVYRSQQQALQANLAANGIPESAVVHTDPFEPVEPEPSPNPSGLALMRVPKSLELFEMYLAGTAGRLLPEGRVLAGFMTRHFTPRLPEIADRYFEAVKQSRAWKKSRLLLLSNPRRPEPGNPEATWTPTVTTSEIPDGQTLRQYPGVFSSGRIDPATRLLMDHLPAILPDKVDGPVMDLGCGNGILSLVLREIYPDAEIHAIDDSLPAVRSAEMNLSDIGCRIHWSSSPILNGIEGFGLVVSNPPFHFEYEIDLSLPLRLLDESRRILRPGGMLVIVANRHLNYSTHLRKSFADVETVASADKFEILRAIT